MINKVKKILINKERNFWANDKIVNYFAAMPADPFIINSLSLIKNRSTKKALDLGCGGGRHTETLFSMGFQTYACDVSDKMVKYTKQRIVKKFFHLNIESAVKYGSILDIPFQTKMFDVIIATGVLHQAKSVSEYKQAIKEVARVSKSECLLYLDIFTNKEWDPTYTKVKGKSNTVITKERLYMTLLSREFFYQLMSKHGFELYKDAPEKTVIENTGPRAILKAIFVKKDS